MRTAPVTPPRTRCSPAGVEVMAIPDCGHSIMLDNPEAFARAIA